MKDRNLRCLWKNHVVLTSVRKLDNDRAMSRLDTDKEIGENMEGKVIFEKMNVKKKKRFKGFRQFVQRQTNGTKASNGTENNLDNNLGFPKNFKKDLIKDEFPSSTNAILGESSHGTQQTFNKIDAVAKSTIDTIGSADNEGKVRGTTKKKKKICKNLLKVRSVENKKKISKIFSEELIRNDCNDDEKIFPSTSKCLLDMPCHEKDEGLVTPDNNNKVMDKRIKSAKNEYETNSKMTKSKRNKIFKKLFKQKQAKKEGTGCKIDSIGEMHSEKNNVDFPDHDEDEIDVNTYLSKLKFLGQTSPVLKDFDNMDSSGKNITVKITSAEKKDVKSGKKKHKKIKIFKNLLRRRGIEEKRKKCKIGSAELMHIEEHNAEFSDHIDEDKINVESYSSNLEFSGETNHEKKDFENMDTSVGDIAAEINITENKNKKDCKKKKYKRIKVLKNLLKQKGFESKLKNCGDDSGELKISDSNSNFHGQCEENENTGEICTSSLKCSNEPIHEMKGEIVKVENIGEIITEASNSAENKEKLSEKKTKRSKIVKNIFKIKSFKKK